MRASALATVPSRASEFMARLVNDVPGLALGACLLLLGALLIPTDPPLEALWDLVHERLSLTAIAATLTSSGDGVAVVVLMVVIALWAGRRRLRIAGAALAAVATTSLICAVMKHIVGRGRPEPWGEANVFAPLSGHSAWHSFPSGTAANAAVVAMFIALVAARLRTPAGIWAAAVGISRVALDRHFFGDVLAGWGVGIAVTSLVMWRWGLLAQNGCGLSRLLKRRSRLHMLGAGALLLVAMPTDVSNLAGIAIILAGALLRIWALGHVRKNQEVCRTGPYALVRHPLYLSNIIVAVGVCVMANWWVLSVILIPLALALHSWLIKKEERALREAFGQQYQCYAREVPALIPSPRSLSTSLFRGRYNWSLAFANGATFVLPLVGLAYLLMQGKQELLEVVVGTKFVTTFGLWPW